MGCRAIHRAYRPRAADRRGPPNAASRRGLAAAVRALNGEGAAIVGDDAIAAMEERRLATERAATRQPDLGLRVNR